MSARSADAHLAATLRQLVEGTAGQVGEAFFSQLVEHLSVALGTHGAWITEWKPKTRTLQALSFYVDGRIVDTVEYAVEGTPCRVVVDTAQTCHVADNVLELYPDDQMLADYGSASYIGVPLTDTDGSMLGHLGVIDNKPMPPDPLKEAILGIFSARAGAELRRLRRDRQLEERTRKLERLLTTAMDAIVEVDDDLRIQQANAAAEETFGREFTVGSQFDRFLTTESRGKLRYVFDELGRKSEDKQSSAIPYGMECIRAGGERFTAEGTASRWSAAGRTYFTLVLRDVNERLEAEERIGALLRRQEYLESELEAAHGFSEIVGRSPALQSVLRDVEQVAATDATVLITGETGTGKELIARAIHQRSQRLHGPLVRVNCAAIPATLQESEFFGHEKGAFTGATRDRDGRFKLADGGTLFLDEVGELPLDLQAKLLRVVQEGEFEPVGSATTEKVDVRVVAATNRDLSAMVRDGAFRQDLLYRLNVFPIALPPLRERGDDVIFLAQRFVGAIGRKCNRADISLDEADCARLKSYDWPGNIRELHNVIERAVITSADGRRLNLDRALPAVSLSDRRGDDDSDTILRAEEVRDFERRNLTRALERSGWKISGAGGAAEILGINPNTLSSRMKSLGIKRPA